MFGNDFFWGAGSSSVAIEGAALRSDWHRWEGRDGVAASQNGNNFRERFADDFDLFVEHGLSHVRLTLEWARIEPFPGRVDRDELEHLEMVLLAAQERGLAVWATLHHGSLPGWFSEDTDGFCSTTGPSIHWSRHVDRTAEQFDHLVSTWWPVDDPIRWAIDSHHVGSRPPGRRSEEKTRHAIEGALEATFDAHRLLASGDTPVVGSFGVPRLHASEPAAGTERQRWDDVLWRSWSRAIQEGVFELPWTAPVDRPDMADAFTAVGVAIRSPLVVDVHGTVEPSSSQARRDDAGTAPTPDDLGEAIRRVTELLHGKPLFIAGLGATTADDGWREQLLEGWLEQMAQATNDGLPLVGAFIEPAIDGYDVEARAHLESGVFNRSREPKPSFGWIAAQT